jgi:hypothetical protein
MCGYYFSLHWQFFFTLPPVTFILLAFISLSICVSQCFPCSCLHGDIKCFKMTGNLGYSITAWMPEMSVKKRWFKYGNMNKWRYSSIKCMSCLTVVVEVLTVFFTHFLIFEFSSHGLPAYGHFKKYHLATNYKCLFTGQETF